METKQIKCECGKPIDNDKIREAVLLILAEWRNTNFIEAGGFQNFLLTKLNDNKED